LIWLKMGWGAWDWGNKSSGYIKCGGWPAEELLAFRKDSDPWS
jgi:hypothetical protein